MTQVGIEQKKIETRRIKQRRTINMERSEPIISPEQTNQIPDSRSDILLEARSQISGSSMSSCSSAFDDCPEAKIYVPPRKGRKRYSAALLFSNYAEESPNSDQSYKFQCTFCHLKLSEKAWKRHEETKHLPYRQWVCMPSDTPVDFSSTITESGHFRCVFCKKGYSNDPAIHSSVCDTAIERCLEQSRDARTFYRREHLVQHAKTVHGTTLGNYILDRWANRSPPKQEEWGCGFCGLRLKGWGCRARHIAAHFRAGKDMSMWSNDRCGPPPKQLE